MAKKKKQSKLRRVISALNPTNPKGMALFFALIFALSGAGVYLYQSFAASPSYRTGYLDWRYDGGGKYTPSVTSTDGQLCVASNINSYNAFAIDYHWYVEVYDGYQWIQVRSSQEFQANGNRDHQCFNDQIDKGKTYRVKFDPERRTYMHGTYWVWAYYHS